MINIKKKFTIGHCSDGIKEAEDCILNHGGEVTPAGLIAYEGDNDEVLEAINFLCDEWDYAYKNNKWD